MRKDIEKFIADVRGASYSSKTVKAYEYELKRFAEFTGERAVYNIREIDVRVYLMRLSRKSRTAAQARALSVLNSFFDWLVSCERIYENPIKDIERPVLPRPRPRYLEHKDIGVLVDAVEEIAAPTRKTRDLAMLSLMLYAGVRLSELVSLNREDVDLRRNTVTISSGRGRRQIPLNTNLRRALAQHLATVPPNEDHQLFSNNKGDRLSKDGVYYLITRYMRAAGIIDEKKKASPKTLRHTFCATLLAKGADIGVVKELAGHTSLSSTSIYSEVVATDKRDAVDLLDD